jgi:hypothetical protein
MRKKRLGLRRVAGLMTAAIAVVAVFALMGGGPALADTNGCPAGGTGNPLPDPNVSASFIVSGGTATYTFGSVDQAPTDGVPGLIEYCVYPGTAPGSITVDPALVGADGSAWVDPATFNNFSFGRPDGNPSNIALDGTSYTMGTATWSGSAPATQLILLHINDAAECDALYGGNPGTCFVLPSEGSCPDCGNTASGLTASKDATPSFTRTYNWTIAKSVDQTRVEQIGGSATFNYTVTVTQTTHTDSAWAVSGTITVTNPNSADVPNVSVTSDAITDSSSNPDPDASCTPESGAKNVPANSTASFSYSCSWIAPGPTGTSETNTATVSWPTETLSDGSVLNAGSFPATASIDWSGATPTPVNNCITVTDSYAGSLGTACLADSPKDFKYQRIIPIPAHGCLSYDNTAHITETNQDSNKVTVTVCGPALTGALTMGFWQNKNGQGIISGQAKTGTCASATWLRQFAPFQDLAATSTCSQVATYVYNVIKAANASGAAMNVMLKAQDLATSLDVYFSDPALGTNKINAPAPIGGVKIDLTKICKMIDGSGGTATCSGTFQNASAAFNGATCLYIFSGAEPTILGYAASQSNSGGSTWYGNVKSTQELAKNVFDAINNQVAFSC